MNAAITTWSRAHPGISRLDSFVYHPTLSMSLSIQCISYNLDSVEETPLTPLLASYLVEHGREDLVKVFFGYMLQ